MSELLDSAPTSSQRRVGLAGSPTPAGTIARRRVRTLRRAYLACRLLAHRDGNGAGPRSRPWPTHDRRMGHGSTETEKTPPQRGCPERARQDSNL